MSAIPGRVTAAVLLCVVCIAAGCRREESPSHATVRPPSISTAPPAASPAPVEAEPAQDAAALLPRIAILLDADKGASAVADYRKALTSLCAELRNDAGHGAAKLKSVGLDGAEPNSLCTDVDRAGEALASGSFVQPWTDEVVLSVPSGMDRAAGDHALALLRRRDGANYQLVGHMTPGNDRFEARVRVATGSGRDVLMLCNPHGQQGVYPTTCGFFGSGRFRPTAGDNAGVSDEIELIAVTACGPGASVRLGDVTLQDGRLHVKLVVERFRRERDLSAEGNGDVCTRTVPGARSEFDLAYEIEGDRPRRATPMPREIVDILKQY